MSTKTTFKRVALVAVAALGFGMLSVVPSNAIGIQKITMTPVTGAIVGNAVKTLVTLEGLCTFDGDNATFGVGYASLPALSAPTATPKLTALLYDNNTYNQASSRLATSAGSGETASYQQFAQKTVAAGETTVTLTDQVYTQCVAIGKFKLFAELEFTPDVAGSYEFILLNPDLAYTQTYATIVVGARAAATAFGSTGSSNTTQSKAVGTAGTTGFGTEADGFSAPKTADGSIVETIAVTLRNGGLTTATQLTAGSKLTASISGPGLVKWTTETTPSRASTMGTASLTPTLNVYADGTAGVGTITISNGTTVLGTKKITFYSTTVAKITTVVNHAIIVSGANAADALGYGAVTATVVDADGFPIANKTVSASSDATSSVSLTSATAVTDSYGEATFLVTGGAVAGSANITVATGLITTATGYVAAAPVSVRRGTATVAKYAMSLDKSSYLPGELATMTILLTDSLGLPVADGAILETKSVTSTYALASGALPVYAAAVAASAEGVTPVVAAVAAKGVIAAAGDLGKYTVKFNMPVNSGVQTFTLTLPTLSTVTGNGSVTATVTLDAAAQAASDTAQAAVDAAAEATDAANAATDAANAAAEAADAATAAAQDAADAVAALSVSVAAMVDALKKQITALTNLVIKIQKKVKA
jgi:hypothetical protein